MSIMSYFTRQKKWRYSRVNIKNFLGVAAFGLCVVSSQANAHHEAPIAPEPRPFVVAENTVLTTTLVNPTPGSISVEGAITDQAEQAKDAPAKENKNHDVIAELIESLDTAVDNTNQFIEDSFLSTADYSDQGINYDALQSCLADFSCTQPNQQSLLNILRYALTTSPQITAAQARHEASQAAIEGARWAFWPTPKTSVYRRTADDRYVLNVGIEQPLWTGGRLTAGLDSARAASIVAHSNIGITQLDLASTVIQQYSLWYGAHQKQLVWEEALIKMSEVMQRVNRLQDAGAISITEQVQAQSKYDTAIADQLVAEAAADSALEILAQLIEVPLDSQLMKNQLVRTPSLVMANLRVNDPEMMTHLMSSSPSLVRARAEIAVAEAAVRTQKSEIMPEVFVSLERDQVRGADNDNRAFVGVRSSFGAGLSYGSGKKAAQSELLAAQRNQKNVEREIRQQVSSSRVQYEASEKRINALNRVVESLDRYYDSVNRLFIASGKSSFEVLTAAYDLAIQRTIQADAKAQMLSFGWTHNLHVSGFSALDN